MPTLSIQRCSPVVVPDHSHGVGSPPPASNHRPKALDVLGPSVAIMVMNYLRTSPGGCS
ncbi:hypothetical protein HMPREF9621_02613 [Cutibacterium modestum HL037PA2]|uniref:Uncharacterized protein n=1 Tax=Cutibacterium modestum HL044PA1 TaxID=765109 RepID=A0ABP2K5B5_9ACTN|nr:hypothetical protein HMPREF9621_02613 [Cutibacterium modestum HL037PA2]EFS92072.1 hypothetical protein HMPREF9607_01700 [Cutibacterium modestum HL044PA1]